VCRVLQVLVYPVEHTITKEIPWEVYEVATLPQSPPATLQTFLSTCSDLWCSALRMCCLISVLAVVCLYVCTYAAGGDADELACQDGPRAQSVLPTLPL
jgi:hypothetical protein